MRDTDYMSAHANIKENNVEQTQTKYDLKNSAENFNIWRKPILWRFIIKKEKNIDKVFFS